MVTEMNRYITVKLVSEFSGGRYITKESDYLQIVKFNIEKFNKENLKRRLGDIEVTLVAYTQHVITSDPGITYDWTRTSLRFETNLGGVEFFTRNLDTIDFVFYEYKALLKARAIVLKQKIKDEYEPVFNDKEEI